MKIQLFRTNLAHSGECVRFEIEKSSIEKRTSVKTKNGETYSMVDAGADWPGRQIIRTNESNMSGTEVVHLVM